MSIERVYVFLLSKGVIVIKTCLMFVTHFIKNLLQNASDRFRMLPNASKCFQMLPDASECFRMHQNASECDTECFRMPQNAFNCFQMLSNAIKCFQMFSNAFKCFQMLSNASKCFKLLQIASDRFRMLQNASKCFQMLPDASRWFRMLQNASECFFPCFYQTKVQGLRSVYGLGFFNLKHRFPCFHQTKVWGFEVGLFEVFLFKTPLPLYILRGHRPRKWNSKYMQKRIHRCYCEGSARGSSTPSSRRRMYIVAEECVSFGGNGGAVVF